MSQSDWDNNFFVFACQDFLSKNIDYNQFSSTFLKNLKNGLGARDCSAQGPEFSVGGPVYLSAPESL